MQKPETYTVKRWIDGNLVEETYYVEDIDPPAVWSRGEALDFILGLAIMAATVVGLGSLVVIVVSRLVAA